MVYYLSASGNIRGQKRLTHRRSLQQNIGHPFVIGGMDNAIRLANLLPDILRMTQVPDNVTIVDTRAILLILVRTNYLEFSARIFPPYLLGRPQVFVDAFVSHDPTNK